jgi:ubiquinone biosynthesis protein
MRRYQHILGVLMKHGFGEVVDAAGRRLVARRRRETPEQRQTRPRRLRLALEELGPTFIKLGQLLSTRPDLIPAAYVHELEQLQDQVPPEDSRLILAELESQLGGKVETLFQSFDPVPIAAGSIGQVHRAVTRQGRQAVVKIRRPGIVQTIRTECQILDDLAGLVKAVLPSDSTLEPDRAVREFTTAINKEVDFNNERRNQNRFRRHFAGDAAVRIPEVFEDYCSEGVITMEYVDGLRPGSPEAIRAAGLDPKVLAQRGANFVLRQIFEFGFFHTDPHPGNFFFLPDNVLSVIDFGQVSSLTPGDRRLLGDIVLAVVDADVPRMVDALARADVLDETTDVAALTREMEEMLLAYFDLPMKDIPLNTVLAQSFEIIRRHRVRPPAQFTLMFKALMTIESFAVSLDGDFQIVEHLRPYARKIALQQFDPRRGLRVLRTALRQAGELAYSLPGDVYALAGKFRRGQFQLRVHHEHLENLVHTLDRSSNRISFALIITGLLIASSFLVGQRGADVFGIVTLQALGVWGYIVTAFMGIWLLVSILRSRRL